MVRPTWLSHPEDCIAARDRDDLHVHEMYYYLAENGLVNPNIICVMWIPEDDDFPYTVDNCDIDLSQQDFPYPIYVIIGDHTVAAINLLAKAYPGNPEFDPIPVRLMILKKTQANIEEVLYLGTLDNTLQSIHKNMTQWDCVKQMHSVYVYINTKFKNKQQRNKTWSRYRDGCEKNMPYVGGTFSTFNQVATLPDALWKPIKQIFEGKFAVNKDIKQSIPVAMTHFQHIGRIPHDELVKWLERVLDGTWNCKHFSERCQKYKKQKHALQLTVDYVNQLEGKEKYQDWDELLKDYPNFEENDFIPSIVSMAPQRVKENFNTHAKDYIDKHLQTCKRKKENSKNCHP